MQSIPLSHQKLNTLIKHSALDAAKEVAKQSKVEILKKNVTVKEAAEIFSKDPSWDL